MTITIGIDPHKATHTAVAVDTKEAVIGEHKVRASAAQATALIGWAQGFGPRTWAVESAAGLGYMLAQQLVAAGETVVDVPPVLAARVQLGKGSFDRPDAPEHVVGEPPHPLILAPALGAGTAKRHLTPKVHGRGRDPNERLEPH